jgi:hypothetical protein
LSSSETTIFSDESSKNQMLQTTIPKFVVDKFNLKAGNKLDWSIRNAHGMEILAVTPIK